LEFLITNQGEQTKFFSSVLTEELYIINYKSHLMWTEEAI